MSPLFLPAATSSFHRLFHSVSPPSAPYTTLRGSHAAAVGWSRPDPGSFKVSSTWTYLLYVRHRVLRTSVPIHAIVCQLKSKLQRNTATCPGD